MTVDFTTNLGLAKPDTDEIAREWADSGTDHWSSFNKTILNDYIGNTKIQTYIPLLTGTSANPNLGSGDNVRQDGWFCELPGGFIYGGFILRYGTSGINIGNGFYSVSLPEAIDTAFHTVSTATAGFGDVVGQGSLRDADVTSNSQTIAIELFTGDVVRLFTENTASGRWVTQSIPFVWEIDDTINGSFFYKRS